MHICMYVYVLTSVVYKLAAMASIDWESTQFTPLFGCKEKMKANVYSRGGQSTNILYICIYVFYTKIQYIWNT